MFVRKKKAGPHTYLCIIESYRDKGQIKQRTIANLGRYDKLLISGKLDALIKNMAKFSEKLAVLSAHREDKTLRCWSKEWGPHLVFRRLWEEKGLAEIISELQGQTKVEYDLEQVLFSAVLHRLCEPGSDLQASRWIDRVYDPDRPEIRYHHFIRAMEQVSGMKDRIEENLFFRKRDLFTQLDLVFFDTTSIYFEGEGPEGLAEYGHSKDNRPGSKQMIVGVVMTREGEPLCCEFWPGNMSDIQSLKAVVKRIKTRFAIERVILVCDRGMVSRENIELLEKEEFGYILGVRLRKVKKVREKVLSRGGRYREVAENLRVKEVDLDGQRYIVCLNPEEEKRDRDVREKLVSDLESKLSASPSRLIGNSGYKKYLTVKRGAVVLDRKKVEDDSRFDGKFILTTNTELDTGEIAVTYKNLLQVEQAFRGLKDILATRPVYHQTAENTKGHVFCGYLALMLVMELRRRLKAKGEVPAWPEVIRDLRALQAIKLELDGKSFLLRSDFEGSAHRSFMAVGVKPPPVITQM
ncbi:MAG: IS1634 family transposase [Acidobacteria bacterium]|nr:IS1634 family transposase [Acidobacteriota bacterium]